MGLFDSLKKTLLGVEDRQDEALMGQLERRGYSPGKTIEPSDLSSKKTYDLTQPIQMPEPLQNTSTTGSTMQNTEQRDLKRIQRQFEKRKEIAQRGQDAVDFFSPTKEQAKENRGDFKKNIGPAGKRFGAGFLSLAANTVDYTTKSLEVSNDTKRQNGVAPNPIGNPMGTFISASDVVADIYAKILFPKEVTEGNDFKLSDFTTLTTGITNEISQTKGVKYEASDEWNNANTFERFSNPDFLRETLWAHAPSVASSIAAYGMAAYGNPTAVANAPGIIPKVKAVMKNLNAADLFMGASVANGVAQEAESYGMERKKALALGAVPGLVTAFIGGLTEKSGFEAMNKEAIEVSSRSLIRTILTEGKEIIKTGGKEGFQEFLEEVAVIGANKTYRDVSLEEAANRSFENIAVGVSTGSAIRVPTSVVSIHRSIAKSAAESEFSPAFGLSVKEVDNDYEMNLLMSMPASERTTIEQKQVDFYKQKVAESERVFIDEDLNEKFEQYEDVYRKSGIEANEFANYSKERFLDTAEEVGIKRDDAKAIVEVDGKDQYEVFATRTKEALSTEEKTIQPSEDSFEAFLQEQKGQQEFNTERTELLNDAKKIVGESVEKLRKEVRLMAGQETEPGVKYREVKDAVGNTDFVAKNWSLNRAKADLKREVKDLRQYAKEILTDQDPSFAKLSLSLEKMQQGLETEQDVRNVRRAVVERGERLHRQLAARYKEQTKSKGKKLTQLVSRQRGTILKKEIKNIQRGVREGSLEERGAVDNAVSKIRNVVNNSNLTSDQKKGLLSMVMFGRVNSLTDMDAIIKNIEGRIDSYSIQNEKEDVVKKIAAFETFVGRRRPGKMGKGKLDALTQKIFNFAFNKKEGEGFFAYETDENGKRSYEKSWKKIGENMGQLNTDELTKDEVFELKAQNVILRASGLFNQDGSVSVNGVKNIDIEVLQSVEELLDFVAGKGLDSNRWKVEYERFDESIKNSAEATEDALAAGEELDRSPEMTERENRKFLKKAMQKTGRSILGFLHGEFSLETLGRKSVSATKKFYWRDSTLYKKYWDPLDRASRGAENKSLDFKGEIRDTLYRIYNSELTNKKGVEKKGARKKLIKERGKEKSLGKFELVFGDGGKQTVELKLSRGEIAQIYNLIKQKRMREAFEYEHGYTQEVFDAIVKEAKKNPKDIELADWLISDYYPKLREFVAPHYEQETGMPMPNVDQYSYAISKPGMITKKRKSEAKKSNYKNKNTTAKSLRQRQDLEGMRATGAFPRIEFTTDLDAAMAYTTGVVNDVYLSRIAKDWRKLLSGEFGSVIDQKFGKTRRESFEFLLENVVGRPDGITTFFFDRFLDKRNKAFAQAALMMNPSQFQKQITSTIMWYPEAIEYGVGKKMLKYAIKTPSDIYTGKTLSEIRELKGLLPELKRRGNMKDQDITLRFIDEAKSEFGQILQREGEWSAKKVANFSVEMGDKVGIYGQGVAFYQARKEQLREENPNMSEQEVKETAAMDFIRSAERTQQSSRAMNISVHQVKYGSMGKFFQMFTGTTKQMFRYEFEAYSQASDAKKLWSLGKKKEATKLARIATAKFMFTRLQFMLFQWAATWFRTDDDAKKKVARAGIVGPLNAIFIFGGAIDFLGRIITGDDTFGSLEDSIKQNPALGGLFKMGELSWKAWIDDDDVTITEALTTLGIEIGNWNGLPAGNTFGIFQGIYDQTQGDNYTPLQIIASDYSLGIDTRRQQFKDENRDARKEIEQHGQAINEPINTTKRKVIEKNKELKKKFVARSLREMKAEENNIKAVQKLVHSVKVGEISREISDEAYKQFKQYLKDNPEEAAKRDVVTKTSEQSGIKKLLEHVQAFTTLSPTNISRSFDAIRSGEVTLEKTEGGISKLIISEKKRKEIRNELGADDYDVLDFIVPTALGGGVNIENIRILPQYQKDDFTIFENRLVSQVQNNKISPKKAREIIKEVKVGGMSFKEAYGELKQ